MNRNEMKILMHSTAGSCTNSNFVLGDQKRLLVCCLAPLATVVLCVGPFSLFPVTCGLSDFMSFRFDNNLLLFRLNSTTSTTSFTLVAQI